MEWDNEEFGTLEDGRNYCSYLHAKVIYRGPINNCPICKRIAPIERDLEGATNRAKFIKEGLDNNEYCLPGDALKELRQTRKIIAGLKALLEEIRSREIQ